MDVIDVCQELDTLTIIQNDGMVALGAWRNLKKLKTLYFHAYPTDATKFLLESAAAESLNFFSLSQPILHPDFFIGLSRFKELRVLQFADFPKLTNEGYIIANGVEIQELRIKINRLENDIDEEFTKVYNMINNVKNVLGERLEKMEKAIEEKDPVPGIDVGCATIMGLASASAILIPGAGTIFAGVTGIISAACYIAGI